jgi:hypothetical protein
MEHLVLVIFTNSEERTPAQVTGRCRSIALGKSVACPPLRILSDDIQNKTLQQRLGKITEPLLFYIPKNILCVYDLFLKYYF